MASVSEEMVKKWELTSLLESTLGVDTTVFPTLANNAQNQS
jgi:hypothetical protein